MQDKHAQDFDLQVRSMLADAGAKPSRRVWKGISSRLDAASAPAARSASWGWVRWAGMSLAAAALAAVLFLTRTQAPSIPTIIIPQEQASMLAQTGESAGAPTQVAVPAADPAGEAAQGAVSHPAPRRMPVARPAAPSAHTDAPQEQPAAEAAAAAPAERQAPPQQAAPVARERQRTAGNTPARWEDSFPAEAPVRRVKPRPSLYAQGAISTNETAFGAYSGSAMMAPGATDGFLELGASTYGVPLTLGLGVQFYLAPRLSLTTGLQYSLLTRTFTGSCEGVNGSALHTVQYIGLPVQLHYDLIVSDKLKLYVFGGGAVDYCISNKYRLFGTPDIVKTYPVQGLQFSVAGGFGVEFRLARKLGLYLDPGVNYYFPAGQPKSLRTDKPLMINFDAGLRFNF